MNRIKKTALSIKNNVKSHKAAYAMGLVAFGAIVLQQKNLKDCYAFLEEKGIDPEEYYCPESYEEKMNS